MSFEPAVYFLHFEHRLGQQKETVAPTPTLHARRPSQEPRRAGLAAAGIQGCAEWCFEHPWV